MSDSKRVYHEVLLPLKRALKEQPQHRVTTLALMISSLARRSTAQLSKIASKSPAKAKEPSVVKRLHRWLSNDHVQVEVFYMPFAECILQALSRTTIILAMDASSTARGLQTLMFGVVYKKRLIPLCWLTYKGIKGHQPVERHIEALQKLVQVVKPDANAILVADAEYDGAEVQQWVNTQTNWGYAVRTPKNILVEVQTADGIETMWLEDALSLGQNELGWISNTRVTSEKYGPVMVLGIWDEEYDNPIYMVSNLKCPDTAADAYRKRYIIETLFSDMKGRGFGLEKSHLSCPQRLSRLLLAASLAYMWMIYFGIEVIEEEKWDLIDSTRQDKSLFRLGLDWLEYVLNHDLEFIATFKIGGVMS